MADKFLRNWKLLKVLVLQKWDKLTESELDDIQPVESELVDLIRKKYPDMPKETIVQDVENLGDQILKNP